MTVINLTWQQFERAIKESLGKAGADLASFQVVHDEHMQGVDGDYQVDVSVRFEALGASFLVLVECKHWKNRMTRDEVLVMKGRLDSLGAQKGMLFATGGFQSGAIEYAKAHGIALVHVTHSGMEYFAKAQNLPPHVPTGPVPRFAVCTDENAQPFNADDAPDALKSYLLSS